MSPDNCTFSKEEREEMGQRTASGGEETAKKLFLVSPNFFSKSFQRLVIASGLGLQHLEAGVQFLVRD